MTDREDDENPSDYELLVREVDNLAEQLGISFAEAMMEYESEISFLSAQEG